MKNSRTGPESKQSRKAEMLFLLIVIFLVLCGAIITQITQRQHTRETDAAVAREMEESKQDNYEPDNNILKSATKSSGTISGNPSLSEEIAAHILHGNEQSGGHLFGSGRPCKSEFPSTWDEVKILSTIREIAANDNLPWEKQDNGYFVADSKKDGVRIRVVLSQDQSRIITGYPTNMPRNPCLTPANDNAKSAPAPITPD